ncbi:CLUMA_CG015143, isoform A, partial [Clunio marinus]
ETIGSSLVSTAPAGANVNVNDREKDTKDNNNNTAANNETNGRSAALERAYVHDVYENCEEPVGSIRPKVSQFLTNLDPGSLVCDVGCGNGRYLTAACNPALYSIGVDRCYRLAKVAQNSGGEVAICDNLELPFRDESFDAVLSLAVVHHFATTERRINAIRELARILRIGGRVIITVWALEQKSRRFESQDVLIPWQSPKSKNTTTSDDEEDDDDFLPPYHAYTYNEDSTHSNSSRSQGDGDSSSLSSSSPSDTCYSFVRRALQKLASGKKSPWFLDSWNSKDTKNDSSLDYEDAKDLPIELRRLEDFDDIPEPLSSAGLKSRSLGSILNPPPKQIVRSRSSVPSLGAEMKQSQIVEPLNHATVASSVLSTSAQPSMMVTPSRRPKLIKQKQSITDDPEFPFDENSPYKNLTHNDMRAQLLRKQSSLNEELMAESRIREKERIRKRIQKQMSLNETFLCRSLFTKRLQVIREGFTTKLKTSTGSLERVTKSGIVKIMQNIKSASNTGQCNQQTTENITNRISENRTTKNGPVSRKLSSGNSYERSSSLNNGDESEKIRRHSRESGSDSSKDSSLQSDTSIESEDSFASVIYIPKKPEIQSNKMPSVPTSPLIMPCPTPIHSPAPLLNQRQMCVKETTRFTFECPQPETHKSQKEVSGKKSTTLKMSGSGMHAKINTIITPPSPASTTITNSPPMTSKHLSPKITRQTIKNLPPIPKFKKMSSFPIVRRISSTKSNVVVPKLMSLELFNPETDDLDSDSSEPSSPDSIDSVINALQPQSSNSPTEPLLTSENISSSDTKPAAQDTISNSFNESTVAPLLEAAAVVANKLEDTVEMVMREQSSTITTVIDESDLSSNTERIIINQNDINLNAKLTHHSINNNINNNNNNNLKTINFDDTSESLDNCREHLVDFAEKLSAQLLKELDETAEANANNSNFNDDIDTFCADPYVKKINGDIRNLNLLRDELRERRLMLANLTTKQHLSQEIESGHQSYTSTPPTTIQELEEDDSPPLSAKIQSHLSQNQTLISNLGTPQTTKKQQQKINDFIPEENEENDEEEESSKADEDSSIRSRISFSHLSYNPTNNNFNNTNDTALLLQEDSFDEVDNSSSIGLQQMKQNLLKNIKHPNKMSDSNNNSNTNSCESWANSNSTTASLDSPSVGGGSATHHRYYHVFKEGELDALINKHVGNLHIVSSYYERASWCVVCEKVQVWTI